MTPADARRLLLDPVAVQRLADRTGLKRTTIRSVAWAVYARPLHRTKSLDTAGPREYPHAAC